MKEPSPIPANIVDVLSEVAKLTCQFGRITRTCYHEDKTTIESDTDHTVMVGIIACAFASRYLPELDVGKIAQFAFVHDLVEAYAGDTPTYNTLTHEEKKDKDTRESFALARIEQQFAPDLPWIPRTIQSYERLDTPEARYLKVLDKLMPPLTYYNCQGAQDALHHERRETLEEHNRARQERLTREFPEQKELLETLQLLCKRIEAKQW